MKEWKKPEISELDIMQTAHGNGNGKGHDKYDDPFNKKGHGNGYGHSGGCGANMPGVITPPQTPEFDFPDSLS